MTSPAAPPGTDDLAAACAGIAAEARDVVLEGVELLPSASDQRVVRTIDGWIVRLPIGPIGPDAGPCAGPVPDPAREAAVLALVGDLLPAPVPAVAWTGRHRPMLAYRALDGVGFDVGAYAAADMRTRNRLAASFARFLAVLHAAASTDAAADAGVPTWDAAALLAEVEAHDAVPPQLVGRAADVVEHFREVWVTDPPTAPAVLLHGGFHPGNVVLDGPAGELAGVWGFRHALLGPPSLDLRFLARWRGDAPSGVRRDLMQRVAEQYGRTGVALDVDGARSAMAMADLAMALASGDLRHFDPEHGVWGWPGADRG